MKNKDRRLAQILLPFFTLFTSFATTLCCALPALLITFGFGFVFAGLISTFPWITLLSKYKIFIFIFSGIVLLLSIVLYFFSKKQSCTLNIKGQKYCGKLRKLNLFLLIVSIFVYTLSLFFAFLL